MNIGSYYTFSSKDAYGAFLAYSKSVPGRNWIKQMRQLGVSELKATIAMAGAFENGFSFCFQLHELNNVSKN